MIVGIVDNTQIGKSSPDQHLASSNSHEPDTRRRELEMNIELLPVCDHLRTTFTDVVGG